MSTLILLRHGESEWNRLNLFTGWVDIPLSAKGVEESRQAGKKFANIPIDIIFVSSLIRAQSTATLAMLEHKSGKVPCRMHPGEGTLESWARIYSEDANAQIIPMIAAWQLNERMYGHLQGRNKQEMREKYGAEQVHKWRRSFREAPPGGESLANTTERSVPYFQEQVMPYLHAGKTVLVSAHGNSLRAISMFLDELSEEDVVRLEIPTGEPIFYSFNQGGWRKEPL